MPPRLKILNGVNQGVMVALPPEGALIIGRHPECNLQFNDPKMSVYHCRIVKKTDQQYCIEDLKSTNGTFINQDLVEGSYVLHSGDEIQIGETLLQFFGDAAIQLSNKPMMLATQTIPPSISPPESSPLSQEVQSTIPSSHSMKEIIAAVPQEALSKRLVPKKPAPPTILITPCMPPVSEPLSHPSAPMPNLPSKKSAPATILLTPPLPSEEQSPTPIPEPTPKKGISSKPKLGATSKPSLTAVADESKPKLGAVSKPSLPAVSDESSVSDNQVQVGDYQILKRIGDGAMGQVFKGRHIISGQIVALKMLHSYLMDDISLKRFLQEVQICMQFDHPRIVKVFDFAMYHNRPVIVMEYIDGIGLADLIRNRVTLPLKLALHLAAQIAQGLHYAHKHGVVHRDLNPANVLVDTKYQAKIIDFGMVKVRGTNITVNSETIGTIHYIPAEQVKNSGKVDHRADIYALGATLYHALLGKPPYFDTEGINALTLRITEGPPPPLSSLIKIPSSISNMIAKAMAFDQEKRFNSSQEFFQTLVKELQKL